MRGRLDEVRREQDEGATRAEALAREAEQQAATLARLRAEMQAASRAAQSHEAALVRLEEELASLAAESTARLAELKKRRGELAGTLGALQRMALRPPAAILVAPGKPDDAVRGGLLLRTAVPRIEARATAIAGELAELTALQDRMTLRRAELADAGTALEHERRRLAATVAEKETLLAATRADRTAEARRVETLAREAGTLADLLERLEIERRTAAAVPRPRPQAEAAAVPRPRPPVATAPREAPAPVAEAPREAPQTAALPRDDAPPPAAPSISRARGALSPPVEGKLLRRFGDRGELGERSRGAAWQAREGAQVVAPWDGKVVFAGPFRAFGPILIIEHGEGYHSLIAGLGRIDVAAGQWVLAGEPVGGAGPGGGNPASIYVELRHDGQPVDPMPWFAAATSGTKG
ncbi:MAG: peptidoglycan DD-metalloendopeptidase family protein [Alphaproteobacteria bacterium]